jgi:hypothetical protein
MLFHSELPSAVLVTWIQLRALAWRGWSTPAMSLPEFASIIGLHPSRLSKHLDHLQSASALALSSNGNGKLVISFPEFPILTPDNQAEPINFQATHVSHTHEAELSASGSYFPRQILGYLTIDDGSEIPDQPIKPPTIPIEADKVLVNLNHIHSLCSQESV